MWDWFYNACFPFFRNLVKDVISSAKELIDPIKAIIVFAWSVVAGFFALCLWSIEKLAELSSQLDFSELQKPSASMIQYYTFINRFVPLNEAFAGAVVCFNIWLVVILIRWIKSVIPTVAN